MRAWRLIFLRSVTSTNDVVRRAGDRGLAERLAVVADFQTRGRGQQGRAWIVPPGRGLLVSSLWRPRVSADQVPTLAQVAGVACLDLLRARGLPGALKWPNDLLLGERKAGGILIEGVLDGAAVDFAVMGIGLNVNQSAADLPPSDYPATSLALVAGVELDRGDLLTDLIEQLDVWYDRWQSNPRRVFEAWRAGLASLGRPVVLVGPNGRVAGRAIDVEPSGALVIERPDGRAVRAVSGELSLRD